MWLSSYPRYLQGTLENNCYLAKKLSFNKKTIIKIEQNFTKYKSYEWFNVILINMTRKKKLE